MSLGALLATEVSGSPAWSGMSSAMNTLGAALLALPRAHLAQARGQRVSLTTAATIQRAKERRPSRSGGAELPLRLVGLAGPWCGTAMNVEAHLGGHQPGHQADPRGRDLSLVVWSTTIGAVAGPNLFAPERPSAGTRASLAHRGFGIEVLAQPFQAGLCPRRGCVPTRWPCWRAPRVGRSA